MSGVPLSTLSSRLDSFFGVPSFGPDPSMSRFVPQAYARPGSGGLEGFETAFRSLFNGLMVRGSPTVHRAFAAAFPSVDVVQTFLSEAETGDLLFVHHAVDLRNGTPEGTPDGTWVDPEMAARPLAPQQREALRERGLSVYACHAPLDIHPEVSTSVAMVERLGGTTEARFFPYGPGTAGIVCRIPQLDWSEFLRRVAEQFHVPFLEKKGGSPPSVERIAVVGGCGDRVEEMVRAQGLGVDAYLTGELHLRWEGERGRSNFRDVERLARSSRMALVGCSHAASEHAVMETGVPGLFQREFGLKVRPIPEPVWWR